MLANKVDNPLLEIAQHRSAAAAERAVHRAESRPGNAASEALKILRRIGEERTFAQGEVVFWEDEPNEQVYFVLSGAVSASKVLSDGRRFVARFVFPGQFTGNCGQSHHPYTAEAIAPVTVLALPRKQLETAASDEPSVRDFLMRSLLSELQEMQSLLLTLGQLSATERVYHFLTSMSLKMELGDDGAVRIPMCRTDIADYLGLTIETVSRVISRLKHEGKISLLGNNRIVVNEAVNLIGELSVDIETSNCATTQLD